MFTLNYTKEDEDLKFIIYCYDSNATFKKSETLSLVDASSTVHTELDSIIKQIFVLGSEEATEKKILEFKKTRKTVTLPKDELSVINLLCYINAVKNMLQTGNLKNKEAIDKFGKTLQEKGIKFDPEFLMLEVRAGKIESIEDAEGLDKIYCEQVQANRPYQICSGLRQVYKKEELLGNTYLFLLNIKENKFKSLTSAGMICCASKEAKVEAIKVGTTAGTRIAVENQIRIFEDLEYGKVDFSKKAFKKIFEEFKIIDHFLCFKGNKIMIEGEFIKTEIDNGDVH